MRWRTDATQVMEHCIALGFQQPTSVSVSHVVRNYDGNLISFLFPLWRPYPRSRSTRGLVKSCGRCFGRFRRSPRGIVQLTKSLHESCCYFDVSECGISSLALKYFRQLRRLLLGPSRGQTLPSLTGGCASPRTVMLMTSEV